MAKKLRGLVLKQYNVGQWLGATKNVYGRALAYQSITSIFLLSLTAWNTLLLRNEFRGLESWLSYPLFLGILFLVLLLFMAFVYKFEIPSSISFGNVQGWEHNNQIRLKLEQMEKDYEAGLEQVNTTLLALTEKLEALPQKEVKQ